MRTIAQRGDDGERPDFLVVEDNGEQGVVVEAGGTVHPPFNVHSILNRGGWDDVTDRKGATRALRLAEAAQQ